MIKIKVELKGLDKLLGDLRKLGPLMQAGLHRGVEEATYLVAAEMRAYIDSGGDGSWPPHSDVTTRWHGAHALLKFTGALYGSIRPEVAGVTGKVVVGTDYAPFHESGTSKMPARPFMYPVGKKVRQEVIDIIVAAVTSAMAGLTGQAKMSPGRRGAVTRLLGGFSAGGYSTGAMFKSSEASRGASWDRVISTKAGYVWKTGHLGK